jgi:hypothetical protein
MLLLKINKKLSILIEGLRAFPCLFTRLRGFEPLTVRLEGVCSILLS